MHDEPAYPSWADTTSLDQAFARIAQALLEYRAEFLFGSGMSQGSGLPTGPQLARTFIKKYFPAPTDPLSEDEITTLSTLYPFEAIASAIGEIGTGRRDLTELLKSELLKSANLTAAHELLSTLCLWEGRPHVKRIFTTNFDKLLEQQFGRWGETIHRGNFVVMRDVEREGRVPIIHLHGVLDADYDITEEDTFRSAYDPLHAAFRSALSEADAFVFVGYSMSDPDFRSLYMRFRDDVQGRALAMRNGGSTTYRNGGSTTYIVSPCENERAFDLGRNVWRRRGATWIPLGAAEFFKKLRIFVEHLAGQKMFALLAEKYSESDLGRLRQRATHLAEVLLVSEDDALQFLHEARSRSGSVV